MANALMDAYDDYATAHTAVEAIDDSKVISVFAYKNPGNNREMIVVVRKT